MSEESTGTGNQGEGNQGEGNQGDPWHASYDADTRGWLENRGLTKLDAKDALPKIIDGFRNAEKKLGVPSDQMLRLPADRAAEGAMTDVWNKLGRPDESGGYTLPTDAGGDDKDFEDWARGKFHGRGLTQDQASGLYQDFTEMIATATTQNETEAQLENDVSVADLKREWGNTYERNLEVARGAIRALGADNGVVDTMEELMGYPSVIKLFNNIGQKIGEDRFASGDTNSGIPGMPSTPVAAQARINELKNDTAFVKKYNAGDTEARKLMTNLHKIAAAGG